MTSADDERRERSSALLGSEGWATDGAGLLDALRDGDLAARSEAAFLLGWESAEEVVEGLTRALTDEEARVRVEAARSLARAGPTAQAREVLRAELDGQFFEDAPLRAAAGLAGLGDTTGYERVREALGGHQPAERLEGLLALRAFLPFDGRPDEAGSVIGVARDARPLVDDTEPIVANEARRLLDLADEA